jgi:hypothetical protein
MPCSRHPAIIRRIGVVALAVAVGTLAALFAVKASGRVGGGPNWVLAVVVCTMTAGFAAFAIVAGRHLGAAGRPLRTLALWGATVSAAAPATALICDVYLTPEAMGRWVTYPLAGGVVAGVFALGSRLVRINLAVFLGLLVFSEGAFWAIAHWHGPTVAGSGGASGQSGSYYSDYFARDPVLGYRAKPGRRATSKRWADGRTIYNVTYTTTAEGRRLTPPPPTADRFVAFFGDSFMVGEGVEDWQTLPAQTQAQLPGARAYNFGFHGFGPQQMLAILETDGEMGEVVQRRGVAVYGYIDGHIQRLKGALQVHAWGHHMPRYVLGADGSPVHVGNMTSSRPLLAAAYPLLRHSNVAARFFPDPLSREHDEDYVLAAAVFERSCRLFAQRFQSDGCLVLLFPGAVDASRRLAPLLAERGIEVLDLSSMFGPTPPGQLRIPGDGHFTPWGYGQVADRLAEILRRRGY